ncbi:MAG: NADP-dependent malic enzyme, partial [Candidatus Falkowbacteria bacterium]|nr:NADP-dependent malic enzyme [Candidatus Falkowbacteria bacterium]
EEALKGADVFIGVSAPGILKPEFIKLMADKPIVFAMANPVPEIMPDLAYEAGASIVGTGRSDFPNQINNALVFPGIFKGLLENKIKKITLAMKLNAAKAIADSIKPTKDQILPNVTDKHVVSLIAKVIV